jgi:TetR/AcrR family transcriptional regulator, multidrug resistance operon repressor
MRTRNSLKEQLVKRQAMKMIVKEGLDGFTVNKLAKACNISVATLYIYYKDKDDLIMKIAHEETARLREVVLKGFDTEVSFEEGMRAQWKNRAALMMDDPLAGMFLETMRASVYSERVYADVIGDFQHVMSKFMKNAVANGEVKRLPLEVFWSIAFAPLYTLVTFHQHGRSIGGKPFVLNDKILWQTFDLVIKGLKK